MIIAIGCDHGGINLKEDIKKAITDLGHTFLDFGTFDEKSVDYPDYAKAVALAIKNSEAEKGVLICGTGIGISIAANKIKGIRCAHCTDVFSAEMTVRHNDANIIALGGRITSNKDAYEIVKTFLSNNFEGERHQKRLDKIAKIEDENL